MKQRCHNPECDHYADYGGRGITVCDRWRESFLAFWEDMGDPPTDSHEVDRIDNDRGYGPDNCRWATRSEQMRNTRNNRPIEFRGRTQLLVEWAEELGISIQALIQRIENWGIEKALSSPGPRGRTSSPMSESTCRWITFDGQTKTLSQWSKELGISRFTLHQRIKSWGVERAFRAPPPESATYRWITFRGETKPLSDWAEELGFKQDTLRWRIRRWGIEKALTVASPQNKDAG